MTDQQKLAADIFARKIGNNINSFAGKDWKERMEREAKFCIWAAATFTEEIK